MHIQNLLTKHTQICPGKAAIIFEGRAISFSELKEKALRVGNYLYRRGIGKEEKVALFLANTPEAVFSFLGVYAVGACVVPLDFMLTEEEVINLLNHSQAKILITYPRKGVDLAQVKSRCPHLQEIVVCAEAAAGFTSWDTMLKESKADEIPVTIDQNDLSSIFYTSGSTGHPKGVMLNYAHLDNPPYAVDYFLKLSAEDIFLCGGVPFSHVGGLVYILLTLRFSTTLVLMRRFHPFEFLKNIQEHRATIFCIVPAMFMAILSLKDYEGFDFSCLRYAVVFGAPSSPELLKRFHQAYPKAQLGNGWGMTETAAPNTLSVGDANIRSIGKFTPNIEVKVINDKGDSLGPNQRGELMLKGQPVMTGYFKEPELTSQALTGDGWLKTGDVAYFDEAGFYYIVGRKKDMIKVAGEIVFSAEVEEKILKNPKVQEAAVIGVADKLRGEVPKAFIAAKAEQTLDEQELKEFLKEHLAHFKMPHYFVFVDELPKNRTGKIDKTRLS